MNPEPDRAQVRKAEKAALEACIERQRVDLIVESSRWREATRGIDHAWHAIARWKGPLYAVGGIVLIATARKPGALKRWARRGVAGAFLAQRVRRLVSAFR